MSSSVNLVPPGWGFEAVPRARWLSRRPEEDPLAPLLGKLLIWEPPRKGFRYVIPVDVAEGVGGDRSVADVIRVGDLQSPDEQVAQFISDDTDPIDLAHVVDTLGRFYADADGTEALVAIEVNNHGLATQSELQRHLGYSNFFVWQVEDVRADKNRYSNRVGWVTNQKTRPIIVSRLLKALKTIRDKDPWILINSPFTIAEMQNFRVEDDEPIFEARATQAGTHDDCLMTLAIGIHIVQTLHFEGGETVADQRSRRAEEERRRQQEEEDKKVSRDWQNTAVSLAEMKRGISSGREGGAEWLGTVDFEDQFWEQFGGDGGNYGG